MALLLVLGFAGCGERADEESARRHTDEVLARIDRRLAHERASASTVPAGLEAPRGTRGEPAALMLSTIALFPGARMTLDGRELGIDQVVLDLSSLRRNWGILHPRAPYPGRVYVWADGSLTLADVRRRLTGVEEETLLLLVDDTEAMPMPPCPSSLPESCSLLADPRDPAGHDRALRRIGDFAFGRCPTLLSLAGSVAHLDALARVETYRRELPAAMRACPEGSFDAEALELHVAIVFGDPEVRAVPLASLPVDDTTTVADALRTP
ncbi:MAG: hypothetical protein U0353_08795 [Sandaracinus sp.]